ncbi:MAG: hypothetical protein J6S67_20875 [Methanobrevibacter sp.]|nr:hypothetical protein [Methanobrevibacter sp.]
MELKEILHKPYTEEQRLDFIVENNHNSGYEIRETETALEAWGYTEEEEEQRERERLDALTLTPADVERALYKAKGMDFDDLKELIHTQLPQVDIKGLAIEFRAKDFYRGAVANGMRLFDVVGALLGYTSSDMDYLFENKELPAKEE